MYASLACESGTKTNMYLNDVVDLFPNSLATINL